MKRPVAYLWYPSDALSSSRIQRMTLEEEGAYRRLLDYQFMDGFIPNDISELSRMCKCGPRKMAQIWERINDRFEPKNGDPKQLVNLRLERVRQEQTEYRKRLSDAGVKGATASWQGHVEANGKSDGKAIPKVMTDRLWQTHGDPSPSLKTQEGKPASKSGLLLERFSVFWSDYPRKIGKLAAMKAWKNVNPDIDLTAKILTAVALAKQSKQWQMEGGRFIPYPATWLNQGRWDDELTPGIKNEDIAL